MNAVSKILTIDIYREIYQLLEKGRYEEASQRLREYRAFDGRSSANWSILNRLLSARIAIKAGQNIDDFLMLDDSQIQDAFLRGEVIAVKGLYLFQLGKFAEGSQLFERASRYYRQAGSIEKEILARYNALIGKTHFSNENPLGHLSEFVDLERGAREANLYKILGLVHRQKSYMYKESGKFFAALDEANLSIPILEVYGSLADYNLALLNASEICLHLNDISRGKVYFEKTLTPFDQRVQFAVEFIGALLENRTVNPKINRLNTCVHFLQRYEVWQRLKPSLESSPNPNSKFWDATTGILNLGSVPVQFRIGGKEYQLIDTLIKGPQSKTLLCEKLWPEYVEISQLDNRLHRLVSRINKRQALIEFEDSKYRIRSEN